MERIPENIGPVGRGDAVGLSAILDQVHDHCIDLDCVRFDVGTGQLVLPVTIKTQRTMPGRKFLIFPRREPLEVLAELELTGVTSYEAEDSDEMRECMINMITIHEGHVEVTNSLKGSIRTLGEDIGITFRRLD